MQQHSFWTYLTAVFNPADLLARARIDHRKRFAAHCFLPLIVNEDFGVFDIHTEILRQ